MNVNGKTQRVVNPSARLLPAPTDCLPCLCVPVCARVIRGSAYAVVLDWCRRIFIYTYTNNIIRDTYRDIL